MRLTDAIIKRLPAPEHDNRVTFDDAVKGFGVRITAAGSRAFVSITGARRMAASGGDARIIPQLDNGGGA